jgi:hypothetical protein
MQRLLTAGALGLKWLLMRLLNVIPSAARLHSNALLPMLLLVVTGLGAPLSGQTEEAAQ